MFVNFKNAKVYAMAGVGEFDLSNRAKYPGRPCSDDLERSFFEKGGHLRKDRNIVLNDLKMS